MSQANTEPYTLPPNSQNLTGFPSPNNKTIGTPRQPNTTNHTYSRRKTKGITRTRRRSRSKPKYTSKNNKYRSRSKSR